MKISENWLREWVNPPVDATALAEKLNLAGLECEAEPLTVDPPRVVVVARILKASPHPQADRLQVCEVDAGTGAPLQIVCGAANARPGILVPAALPGAVLPGGKSIGAANLRGVDSAGMLCSASELGLAEKSEGLLELDLNARPGTPIEKHLGLDDRLLNLELTPNRGDCLSIAGVARELTDACLQFWGGQGYMWESSVAQFYRDLRLHSIGGGADEVMLGIISKRLGYGGKRKVG